MSDIYTLARPQSRQATLDPDFRQQEAIQREADRIMAAEVAQQEAQAKAAERQRVAARQAALDQRTAQEHAETTQLRRSALDLQGQQAGLTREQTALAIQQRKAAIDTEAAKQARFSKSDAMFSTADVLERIRNGEDAAQLAAQYPKQVNIITNRLPNIKGMAPEEIDGHILRLRELAARTRNPEAAIKDLYSTEARTQIQAAREKALREKEAHGVAAIEATVAPLGNYLQLNGEIDPITKRPIPGTRPRKGQSEVFHKNALVGKSALDSARLAGIKIIPGSEKALENLYLSDGKWTDATPTAIPVAPPNTLQMGPISITQPSTLTPPPESAISPEVRQIANKQMAAVQEKAIQESQKAATAADKNANGIADKDEEAMAWALANKKTDPLKATTIINHMHKKYPGIYGVKDEK